MLWGPLVKVRILLSPPIKKINKGTYSNFTCYRQTVKSFECKSNFVGSNPTGVFLKCLVINERDEQQII